MRALLFMAYIKGEAVTQGNLFPVSLDELVPADHLVRVVAAYVDGLSLDALGFSKAVAKTTGRPPYDPADMLKLYLYGYLHRIRSSRRLESECQRNVEVMWLLSRLTPDFKTIAEFRRLNGKAFAAVCRSFVQFCRHAGLMAGELVAIDGSKFQAAASRKQHISAARLAKQQADLDKQISAYLTELDRSDKHDAATAIDRSAVQAALQHLQQQRDSIVEQQHFLQKNGLQQYVQTEPDARMMRHAHGKMVAYNVQTAVDAQHGLIVHHDVTHEGNDSRQLLPVAVATKAALQQETLTAVADAGYSNGEQFQACEEQQIEAFVPANRAVNNQSNQQHFQKEAFVYCADSDSWRCPNHCTLTRKQMNKGSAIYAASPRDCAACPLKSKCTDAAQRFISRHAHEAAFARMATRLAKNPEMMRWRRQTVEHPFGNIKQWIMGNGRFLLWGLRGASTEMALAVTAYNLKRAINILGTQKMMALLA
jgi:transposase